MDYIIIRIPLYYLLHGNENARVYKKDALPYDEYEQENMQSPFEQSHRQSESSENHKDIFNALCDKTDELTKQTPGYRRIVAEAEESGDYKKAVEQLRKFISKRHSALYDPRIRIAEGADHITIEGAKHLIIELTINMAIPEKFLGNGATCEVFTLRDDPAVKSDEMTCIKVVTDYKRYAEGRTVGQEMYVLERLRKLNVDGARSPTPLFSFSGFNFHGLAMAHLDAVNARRMIEEHITEGMKDELPQRFDMHRFEEKIRAYVKEMHGLGVVHNDLHLRNIMINRQTGDPCVIDFGKALLNEENMDEKTSFFEMALKRDYATLDSAMIELRKWIESRS